MFEIYPGFEELELRVEVQWREQTRTVIARVERWPDSDRAVLICELEDDAEAGEWIVTDYRDFYTVPWPHRCLSRPIVVSRQSPYLSRPIKLKPAKEKKFRLLLQGTFNGGIARHGLARIFYLSELPTSPNVVVQMPDDDNLCWCPTSYLNDAVPFALSESAMRLSSRKTEAEAQLRSVWQDEASDARFGWRWSSLSKDEKFLELTGLYNKSEVRARIEEEMRRVMRLILIYFEMWGPDEQWNLYFTLGGRSHISHEDGRLEKNNQQLHKWNALLREYLMPQFHADWDEKHRCVGDCWSIEMPSVSVEIEQPPTAHEQLEAKLALRDWLRGAATPDVAAALLASLDD